MIYLDNIIFSLQRVGGISIVWENLIRGISEKIPINYLEYKYAERNIHRVKLEIEEKLIQHRRSTSLVLEQFKSPSIFAENPFIFHSSFYRFSNHKLATNITTVHDFIYEMMLNRFSLSNKIRCALTHRAIINSDHIVCISENTKADLLRLIPDVKEKPIYVIYNGVSTDYHRLSNTCDEKYKDFLLFVGSRQGYKNFDFAIEMTASSKYKLLICGNDLTEKEIKTLNRTLGSDGYEFHLRPSNKQLNFYYNSVKALLYPSSYEGFGIPILEAQRAGCPVIALNTSSIPEVIGETPLLLQSLDERSFKRSMRFLDSNSEVKNIVESGLINSKRFSWTKMATEYLELYYSLI